MHQFNKLLASSVQTIDVYFIENVIFLPCICKYVILHIFGDIDIFFSTAFIMIKNHFLVFDINKLLLVTPNFTKSEQFFTERLQKLLESERKISKIL